MAILTVLIATPAIRREVRLGKVRRLSWTTQSHKFLRLSPHHMGARAVVFGFGAALFLAAPIVVAWSALGVEALSYSSFFTYKLLLVIAIGCLVTTLNALWVLSDPRRQEAR